MENKHLLGMLAVAAVAFAISVASAHGTGYDKPDGAGMMKGNYVHDQDDIGWMKDEMKEHMDLTDEEVNEMAERCPMMRGR